jgi:F-type H+-transporting ATPase subunit alpha
MDDVAINKIGDFEAGLLEYMNNSKEVFMTEINNSGAYNDEIEATLKSSIEEFKKTGTW